MLTWSFAKFILVSMFVCLPCRSGRKASTNSTIWASVWTGKT